MTVRAKQAKLFIVAVVLAVAAAGGCGGQRSGSRSGLPSATVPPDLVKFRGLAEGDGESSDSFEVIADGNRRFRLTMLSGEFAGYYEVWDGKTVLTYSPIDDPKYQRTENPTKDEFSANTFFYKPDSEEFKQWCPAAKRLGTKTMFGRTAVRYHCDKVEASDQTPDMDAREIALDEKTGLVMVYGDPSEVITEVTFGPVITADTFSTKLPPGANTSVATPEAEIGSFRLNAVGGGFVDSTSYSGGPIVIVAGSAAGIRAAFGRLLPMTRAGKPPVVGFLLAMPPADWKGTLTNQKDVDQLAASISKSVGTFAAPVGIDFKGAASWAFLGDATVPPDPTQVTIALVTSSGTLAHVTPAGEVTDATLRTWIAALP